MNRGTDAQIPVKKKKMSITVAYTLKTEPHFPERELSPDDVTQVFLETERVKGSGKSRQGRV